MKRGYSFAGPLANTSVPELQVPSSGEDADSKRTPEDPAVFGGSTTAHLPEGTVVEFPEEGGYRVVEPPEK